MTRNKLCGIYCIKNNKTNKVYIGSSVDIKKRIQRHFRELTKNEHHSIYLQRSYNNHKRLSFDWEIIGLCDRKNLLQNEQYCIDLFNAEYNVTKDTKSPMSGRTHTDETKRKMSEVHKGNTYNLGRKQPKEEREMRGNLSRGRKHSIETKRRMSQIAKETNSISRINRERQKKRVTDSEGNTFASLVEAGKFWGKSTQVICDILKGRSKKTREGISFEYTKTE